MTTDLITLIANVALTLSFIVALIFGVAQVKAAARDRRERLTLETLRNFQTREFAELMYYIISRKPPSALEEWRSMPDSDQIVYLQFLQQMESLGILVAESYIDLDLVDKTLGSFVTTAWGKFEKVVLDIRVKQNDPFMSEYFQWLADRISERMEKNPRKPFMEEAQK